MKENESQYGFFRGGMNLSRRELLRIALITGVPIALASLPGCSRFMQNGIYPENPDLMRYSAHRGPGPLPQPVINPRSTELCLNSRISYHAGWSGTASDQWLSNVLHACRRIPTASAPVTVYAATPDNLYVYDPSAHALNVHIAGNKRGDSNSAFQLGFASVSTFDAGVAQHLAQVASIALWNGTTSQLGSCPRDSDRSYANSNWSPVNTIQAATTFGIRTVAGFKTTLNAISSDGSLPSPSTDGTKYFDNVVKSYKYSGYFKSTDLTLQQLSQLLWGTYGCSAHNTTNGRAGLTVASAVANYYLTQRIYMISHLGVHRFHNRIPPGSSLSTKDHRIELLSDTDIRNSLKDAISGLPSAPAYFVMCLDTSQAASNWGLLEVGYCAGSLLLQASSIGLNSYFKTDFSSDEKTSIQGITGIPSANVPVTIVSSGLPNILADLNASMGINNDYAKPDPR
jgi:hypothetical protein